MLPGIGKELQGRVDGKLIGSGGDMKVIVLQGMDIEFKSTLFRATSGLHITLYPLFFQGSGL
jgi:hypothetical protein